jgi:hypothetical protein
MVPNSLGNGEVIRPYIPTIGQPFAVSGGMWLVRWFFGAVRGWRVSYHAKGLQSVSHGNESDGCRANARQSSPPSCAPKQLDRNLLQTK